MALPPQAAVYNGTVEAILRRLREEAPQLNPKGEVGSESLHTPHTHALHPQRS